MPTPGYRERHADLQIISTQPAQVYDLLGPPGPRLRYSVRHVHVFKSGTVAPQLYRLRVSDGADFCHLSNAVSLGLNAATRFEVHHVLADADRLQLDDQTGNALLEIVRMHTIYAEGMLEEGDLAGRARTSLVTIDPAAGSMTTVVARPGERYVRNVRRVTLDNRDSVPRTFWLRMPTDATAPAILWPGVVVVAAGEVAHWDGPFVLEAQATDDLEVYSVTATVTTDARVYASYWEERLPEKRVQ